MVLHIAKFLKNRSLPASFGIGFVLYLLSGVSACSTTPAEEELNSDRILARFGSYGVEVLYADGDRRISSLFSESHGGKTTRTLAIVQIQTPVPAAIAGEHREILAGGSIGKVFRENGWSINKRHIFVGDLEPGRAAPSVYWFMRIPAVGELASHVYVFNVSNGTAAHDYATIIEIHHPDYLNYDQLTGIYGEPAHYDTAPASVNDFVDLSDELAPES